MCNDEQIETIQRYSYQSHKLQSLFIHISASLFIDNIPFILSFLSLVQILIYPLQIKYLLFLKCTNLKLYHTNKHSFLSHIEKLNCLSFLIVSALSPAKTESNLLKEWGEKRQLNSHI